MTEKTIEKDELVYFWDETKEPDGLYEEYAWINDDNFDVIGVINETQCEKRMVKSKKIN